MARITGIDVADLRFPTSRALDGSDAMNPAPDYSAAYATIHTDADDGLAGSGFTFTIGRGNELCAAAIESLAPLLVGRELSGVLDDLGETWRVLTGDSQLRWLGPEKGVIHLATAAIVNAVWDLRAKRDGKPLWQLLADMPPDELVACLELRYVDDVLTPEEAVELLRRNVPRRAEREAELRAHGLPAYTTSAGWLGYPEDKVRELCREAVAAGWTHLKQKVGADQEADLRRAAVIREEIGDERALLLDANQVWGVEEAIRRTRELSAFDPLWMEEPTSPDDVLGHARIAREIAPVRVATGEHVHNRVMFKQLFQADAIGYCQVDATRVSGINEALVVILMAAQHGVTVCPHAGGVGLCENVQHLSLWDAISVAPDVTDRIVEYHDHLHEHFVDPARIRGAAYVVPTAPGASADLRPETFERFAYPAGTEWRAGG